MTVPLMTKVAPGLETIPMKAASQPPSEKLMHSVEMMINQRLILVASGCNPRDAASQFRPLMKSLQLALLPVVVRM